MGYGNLAYELDHYSDYKKKAEVPQKQVQTRAPAEHKAKLNLQLIFMILLVSLSAYFMISKFVMISETEQEIKSLEKQLSNLEAYTSQKTFELEQSVDLTTVEEIATTKLKMQRPEKYQTVYVNIRQDDVTEVTAKDVEGVKSRVSSTANNLKRNFLGIFQLRWK